MSNPISISHIPQEFISDMESHSPTELASMYNVDQRTIRKWKQRLRETYAFVKADLPYRR